MAATRIDQIVNHHVAKPGNGLREHLGAVLFCLSILLGNADAFARGDDAALVSVSVPAGTQMMPSMMFTQTWTMQNTGTATWSPGTSGYTLYLVGKDSLGAVPLSTNSTTKRYTPYTAIDSGKPVAPGTQATFSVSFIAPQTAGSFTDTFHLKSASGAYFGPQVSVQITVGNVVLTNQYDRAKAVSYANNYAGYVVSDGYFWTNGSGYGYFGALAPVPTNLIGDDCAHFVSSCIGNQPAQPGGGFNIPSRVPPTYGEPGAGRLINTVLIAAGHATEVFALSNMCAGDLIGWNWSGNTNIQVIDHVTFYLGHGLLASHAASCLDVSANTWYQSGTPGCVRHLIHIFDGPSITAQPQSLAINAGIDAGFNVTATGTTNLAYQWYFNGTNLAGATNTSYSRTNAQFSDAGSYFVVVTDTTGSKYSSAAVLTVNASPFINAQPLCQVAQVGQTATFSVGAVGSAPLAYQWRFNGDDLPGATNASVAIPGVGALDVGAYSVVVSNFINWVESTNSALILVQDAVAGDNSFGQGCAFAGSTNLIAVAAGNWHNLGLRADGTVSAWGDNSSGQCDFPATLTDALAIAAGGYHSLALRANGAVVAWGANDDGQTNVPAGLTGSIGLVAGTWHSAALRADGTVAAWGDNSLGQTNIPAGLTNVTAVAAGGSHTLALKADGTVVAWGENTSAEGKTVGQSVVPWDLTNVVAIGAGEYHSLALKNDGTVVAWGDNSQDQCNVPPGLTNTVAVVGGGGHSVALGADGKVTAWGADWNGQCGFPAALAPAAGIAAGENHTLVLLADALPVPQLLNSVWQGHRFSAQVQTLAPKNYALEYKDSVTATNWTTLYTNAGNGALRILTDPDATNPQRFYRMRQW